MPRARRSCLFALALLPACTLLESRDGLVGPPLDDAGQDAPAPRDAAPDAPALHDAGVDVAVDAPVIPPDAAPPLTLYDTQNRPIGLTVQGGDLYWVNTTPRALLRAPKAGGGAVVHVEDPGEQLGQAFDVAVDGTSLYFGDLATGSIFRKPLDGGAQQHCFDGAPRAAYLTVVGGTVFVTDFRDDASGLGSVVGGTCADAGIVLFSPVPRASGIAAHGTTLYFGANMPDSLQAGPMGGGAYTKIQDSVGAVGGLATDGVTVYFLVANQKLYRMRLDTRVLEPLYDAGSPFGYGDVALDDQFVYWTESENGRIRALPR